VTNYGCQHNLIFSTIKNRVRNIRHCLLFYFHQKKSAADAHRIICETYDENIIAIKTCRNWFKTI